MSDIDNTPTDTGPPVEAECDDLTGIGGTCCSTCHPVIGGVTDTTRLTGDAAQAIERVTWGGVAGRTVCCVKAASVTARLRA